MKSDGFAPSPNDLLTVRHAAKVLDCSERHVRALLSEAKMPFVKLDGWAVRIQRLDIDAYVQAHKITSHQPQKTAPAPKNLAPETRKQACDDGDEQI